jgi:hypothetical protein
MPRKKPKVIVHVHRQRIAQNVKHCTNEPAIIIRRGRQREYAHQVRLVGEVRMVSSMASPLSCGARVWIEADDAVSIPA